jgi:hypothetical protein
MSTTVSSSFGSESFNESYVDVGNSQEQNNVSVPAAAGGQLTTYTGPTDAVLTMNAGHGFVTGDHIAVFWVDPTSGQPMAQRNCLASVAVNAVTISAGVGDGLPVVGTNVTACKPTIVPMVVNGATWKALGCANGSAGIGFIVFLDSSSAEIATATFRILAGKSTTRSSAGGDANPLGSSTTSAIKYSHGDPTAQTMRASVLFN